MKKIYYLLLFALASQTGYAQWTMATNPEGLRLGVGGVASFNDTLYTGTEITDGFDDDPEAIYKSVDGLTWELLSPDRSFNNQNLDLYSISAVDSFLILSERRQVKFSKDGITWEQQNAITGQDDESTPRIFIQMGDVIIAGIKGDTNDGGDGIYRKEGDGEWETANEGLPPGQDEDAVSTNNMIVSDGRILVPTLEGMYVSDDTAKTWTMTLNQNLTDAAVGDGMIFASTFRSSRAYFYKSEDNGDTFTELEVSEEMKNGIQALHSANGYLFVSVSPRSGYSYVPDKGGVYYSTDGETWTYMGLMGTSVTGIQSDETHLYVTVAKTYTEADNEVGLWQYPLAEVGNGVANESEELIAGFKLNQNYPNPFNPATNISYSLETAGQVSLEVFNSVGQKVATLVNGVQSNGQHSVTFDAAGFPSGMYFYRLEMNGASSVRKMMLLK